MPRTPGCNRSKYIEQGGQNIMVIFTGLGITAGWPVINGLVSQSDIKILYLVFRIKTNQILSETQLYLSVGSWEVRILVYSLKQLCSRA